jgi:hypothetical protein
MELSGVRVQKEDPDILFLTETKMDRGGIEGLCSEHGLICHLFGV